MNTPPACGCSSTRDESVTRLANGPQFWIRDLPYRRRDTCCEERANGITVYPAGGDAPVRAPGESDADYQRRVAAAAAADRAAADRAAALDAARAGVSAIGAGVNQGFETERTRLETQAQVARAQAEATAATERARIEAQRDLELARIRASQPNVQLSPLEASQGATATTRTDSGSSFPVVPGLAVGGLGLLAYFLSKKGRR